MKRNTLSCVSCIATVPNNTYSLHSVTILTHTIACLHIFFSETKHCYTSVVNMEMCKIINFENSQKINKNSYNDNFFAVMIRRKRKLILAKNIFCGQWHFQFVHPWSINIQQYIYLLDRTCRLTCIPSLKKYSLRSNCMEHKRNVV